MSWLYSGHNVDPGLTPIYRRVDGGGLPVAGFTISDVYLQPASSTGGENPNMPSDISAGDLLVMVVGGRSLSAPSGYSSQVSAQVFIFTRIATADANDVPVLPSVAGSTRGRIIYIMKFPANGATATIRSSGNQQFLSPDATTFGLTLYGSQAFTNCIMLMISDRNVNEATQECIYDSNENSLYNAAFHSEDWLSSGLMDSLFVGFKLDPNADAYAGDTEGVVCSQYDGDITNVASNSGYLRFEMV